MSENGRDTGQAKQGRREGFGAHWLLKAAIALFMALSLAVLAAGAAAVAASRSPSLHLSLHESGLGSGLIARLSQGIADASHRVESPVALAIDYMFSLFNLGLAAFLVWLRPRDRAAGLLAVGMIGTAAVFNLQAVAVYEALPKTILETAAFSFHQFLAGGAYVAALLLFPDGKLIPRWPRWAQAALYLPLALIVARFAFVAEDPEAGSNTVRTILFFGLLTPLAAVFSQGYRYRRSPTAEQRQQSKLLFWALVPALGVGLFVLTQGIRSLVTPGFEGRALHELPETVFRVFQPVFALIPIALFVGLVRYRLWKIDRVISRTLLYGLLVAFITAIYVGLVVGLGRLVGAGANNLVLSVVATGLVAIGFQPAKERLQRLANRVVYGKRATPYEVLSELSKGMVEAYGTEELLERMVRALAEGTAAESAEVWLRVGSELRPAAAFPERSGDPPEARQIDGDVPPGFPGWNKASPVKHQSELLGMIMVRKPEGESLSLSEDKLVSDLASQAGLFLRNVRLTAELLDRLEDLRASRQRLVTAQDQERRRIERNLHDGAQQQLVALKMKLALAEKMAEQKGPELRPLLAQFRQDADEALETLRDLARGIYPPLLAAEGLIAALKGHARKLPLEVEIIGDDIGRQPQEVEAAVYFCCLEALQNVLKYAEASRAKVELTRDGNLRFSITDDGKGFDLKTVGRGAGLQNMEDRIEALGGSIEVMSAPGKGTTLTGVIPLEQAAEARPSSDPGQNGSSSLEATPRPGAEPQPA